MSISALPLSYCSNVHPGDSFAEVMEGLVTHTAPLHERIGRPVAVGLWMSTRAITELDGNTRLAETLRDWLTDNGLVCYTMNAFPFGNFHARQVKENVYLPDWTTADRLEYTCQVARLLAQLLPENAEGSISTSPCAFKGLHPAGQGVEIYFGRFIACARYLEELRQRTGRLIRLAIEPEPCCVLETTGEAIAFFDLLRQCARGAPAERAVRDHLGLCFDVCHQAVEFEDVADSVRRLDRAGVPIVKVHITCALELPDPRDASARRFLSQFVEERYLHQTFAWTESDQRVFVPDLSVEHALDPPADWLSTKAWRVHFHVPIHVRKLGPLTTTHAALEQALAAIAGLSYAPHLEVETYTWSVLPVAPVERPTLLVDGLLAEMQEAQAMTSTLARAAQSPTA